MKISNVQPSHMLELYLACLLNRQTANMGQTEEPSITEPNEWQVLDVKTGDIVTFGTYEQDADISNGAEPIEWQVLDVKDGKALLLSKYALDCQQYHEEWIGITWKDSSLRKWLENEFYNSAFTDKEKHQIALTKNENADTYDLYEKYGGGAEGGEDSEDHVFLLSLDEVRKYFDAKRYEPNQAMICYPTKYAFEHGCFTLNSEEGKFHITKEKAEEWRLDSNEYSPDYSGSASCYWWLRSPGNDQGHASSVSYSGAVSHDYVIYGDIAVRPALWVNLKS